MGTKDIAVIIDSKILISQMEIKFQEEEDKYLGSFANNPSKSFKFNSSLSDPPSLQC